MHAGRHGLAQPLLHRRRLSVGSQRSRRAKRGEHRLASRLAGEGDVAVAAARRGHGAEGTHMAAIGLQLVGGLRRAEALQLRGPVARQNDERHPGRFRLDNRRVVVRQGRARGAHERHGATARLRKTQAEKSSPALVDIHVNSQILGSALLQFVGRHGQGRRPRTGAHHHLAHAPAHHLVEKRRHEQRGILLMSRRYGHRHFLSRISSVHDSARNAPESRATRGYAPKAERMVRSFRSISAYSASASLLATMPQPP